MQSYEYAIHLVLSVILIVGAYQFYFFTQKYMWRQPIEFRFSIDNKIPYWPSWSWIYSFLYYPAILYLNLIVNDSREFIMMASAFIMLLFMQMAFFTLFPVVTPDHWRDMNQGRTWSEKFLAFVRYFDDSSNCFPSMHVSVATLTALLAIPSLGLWALLFPVLIALSCIFTKQHYLIDIFAGAVLGVVAYGIYLLII